MRQKTVIVVALSVAFIGAWAAGLYAGNCKDSSSQTHRSSRSRSTSSSSQSASIPQTPGQPTRLQIDVFELTCTNDQLAALDLDKIIADDASPSLILERLRNVGTARLLVRMDDTVDLLQKCRLTHGKQVPVIRDIVVSKGGTVTPSVNYQDVGFIANINGRWREDDPPWADVICNIELSNVTLSHVEVPSGIKLPVLIQFKVEKKIAVQNGKPAFTMSNGLPLPDDEQGTVNVALIRLQATRLAE